MSVVIPLNNRKLIVKSVFRNCAGWIHESDVLEQLLRGDFEIEIGQSQAGILEQTGFGVFVQALQPWIGEPAVRDAPSAIIFQALGEFAVAVVRRTISMATNAGIVAKRPSGREPSISFH
jgi:hypothetical protein